ISDILFLLDAVTLPMVNVSDSLEEVLQTMRTQQFSAVVYEQAGAYSLIEAPQVRLTLRKEKGNNPRVADLENRHLLHPIDVRRRKTSHVRGRTNVRGPT